MKLATKILLMAGGLGLLFAATFGLWGSHFDLLFSQQACAQWFKEIRTWAWAVGIGLLISDLVLPIPATGIMAALGSVYGVWLGGLIAAVGSTGAGFAGYGLAKLVGRKGARLLATDAELERFKIFFDRWGGWGIIISRMLPILPEVMTILAGLARMDLKKFTAALLLGTIPTCGLFAFLGHASRSDPGYGIVTAVALPLLLWPVFLFFMKKDRVGSASSKKPIAAGSRACD
ncbi:MAG: TVP38/TMEM64 family protein [Desulfosarcina sp.]|nr:TVP38/TMEM64 family protein [Desulfosarcina sp.]MBC2744020.1 TVP38/TMEM64 family protein [Desulfosarcina sp.]MBC2766930.1 TVP38/TMEM64 family protein [Desulfosarcina sp.]